MPRTNRKTASVYRNERGLHPVSAQNDEFSRDQWERAVRVARVTTHAEELWGNPEGAWQWLTKPNSRFDGRSPLELLATEAGARAVEEVLLQVEHGVFA